MGTADPGYRYRPPEVGKAERVRHRTPAEPMCRLLRAMRIRFPGRAFLFAGDAGFRPHAVARFCHHRRQLTLVSKLCPDANRFAPPPPYAGNGRPRVSPARVKLAVAWYGGRGTAPSRGCSDWG
ncbi:hypothetical protein J0H58_32580 [bacterium]|nr:hypothetical protein [bacterium]